MKLQVIQSHDIDRVKWNSCVHYAINGNVFGYKFMLDHIGKDWFGIVEDDYQSVMPLITGKTWLGRQKIWQPQLLDTLGLYSVNAMSEKRIKSFLEAIAQLR